MKTEGIVYNKIQVLKEGKTIMSFPFHADRHSFWQVLREHLAEAGIDTAFCGRGSCKACRVRLVKGMSVPSAFDRANLSSKELREGYRYACTLKCTGDLELELCFKDNSCYIETGFSHTESGFSHTETGLSYTESGFSHNEPRACADKAAAEQTAASEEYSCAVDLGTTTIALCLVRVSDGHIVGRSGFMNPGRVYGADVISRLTAALSGSAQAMREGLVSALETQVTRLAASHGVSCDSVVISGNTTMIHILLGYPCEGLASAPFTPFSTDFTECRLGRLRAGIMPGISAFVGGDIVSGIYGLDIIKKEGTILFIDLGTNGELALWHEGRLLVTAAAAGSAFEGAGDGCLYGTDMIEAVNHMLCEDIIDEDGVMCEEYFDSGCEYRGSIIRQEDIRKLQLAKAAIHVGISTLLKHAGVADTDEIRTYIAGGFGQRLDIKAAFNIGLLPERLEGNICAVGNASVLGAVQFILRGDREELERTASVAEPINLALEDSFGDSYMASLKLGRISVSPNC